MTEWITNMNDDAILKDQTHDLTYWPLLVVSTAWPVALCVCNAPSVEILRTMNEDHTLKCQRQGTQKS